ncbi:F0F1 ATP synthase subunit B [uncultured Clostridium sp.]|uniref:F0F1 ATP synthase subunit B n=1 Tax=uncultured Clostridium sp. TaxID=59620 RepID=UPI0028E83CC6|nr:F0F1 ATP synthase subunit B [uncultured Clostridium sp.]
MNFEIKVIPEWPIFMSQLISTLILFLVVKHFLFKPVSDMVNARKSKIENDMLEAKTQAEEAHVLKNQYEQKIEESKDEARTIIALAKQREDEIKQEVLAEAKMEVDGMFIKAKENIKREKEKTMASLKHDIVEMTILTASAAIEKNLDEDTHQEMINKFIHEVGEVEWIE